MIGVFGEMHEESSIEAADRGCCEQNSIVGSGSASFFALVIGSNMNAGSFCDGESPMHRQKNRV